MGKETAMGVVGAALAVLLQMATLVESHTNCRKDWSEYNYYCYYLNTGSYTWEDARTWCRNVVDGGDLVSILSSGENNHVDAMISTNIHIGFNDLSKEGDWQWSDERSVSYTNWNSGEPSGNSGLGNCAGMYTSGYWDDYACSTARPFVCKVAKEWTAVQTGCQCYFDATRYDCACCRDGGCNCGISYPHQCVLCGDANACGQDYSGPIDQWKVVFKAVSSLGSLNVKNLWTGTSTYNDGDTHAPYITYTSDHYKSSDANSWDTSSIKQIKFAFFDSGVEKMSLVFDATGTSRTSWYSSSYLIYAPYTDVYSAGKNYFSMTGHESGTSLLRHFFLSSYYNGCSGDAGWVVVSDPPTGGGCSWDNLVTRPVFLYNTATTRQAFASGSMAAAPVMAIFYKETVDTSDSELCDSGWTHDGNGCYKAFEDTKTWFAAVDACRALGDDVDLVSIHSYDEAMHVLAMSRWTFDSTNYWIGLNDLDDEGDWKWIDGTPYDYSRWKSGEPNNANGMEDCACLTWNTDATWSDGTCGNSYRYICKYPLHVASCAEWKRKGYTSNGYFTIDPDGPYNGVDPFRVYCDMTSDTYGTTVIHHGQETRGYVTGYENPLSYAVDVIYDHGVTMDQVKALLDSSDSCWQYAKYECKGSIIYSGSNYAGWYNRDGTQMTNWAGAPAGEAKCACAVEGTCDGGMSTCSCDVNDGTWRYDEGTITDKEYLPVTKLGFGDTGSASEEGYFTLGALYCRGDISAAMTSRSDFHLIPFSYINGNDNEQVSSSSASSCADQCVASTSFDCLSFEFDESASSCSLSNYNHVLAGGVTSSASKHLYVRKFAENVNLFNEQDNCNSGWVEYDSMCYYPSTTTKTWNDAETWCQSQGGHLTSTENEAEYSFLRIMLRWTQSATDTFMIGYNDVDNEGKWVEADGTTHTFTRWRSSEPNGGVLENAVLMATRDNDDWIDANVESSYQFICKAGIGASAIPQPTENPSCSNGWSSYENSCYYFSSDTKTYSQAQTQCKSMDSDLITIDSEGEWNFTLLYIRSRFRTRDHWVGMTDVDTEGTWLWENGGKEPTGTAHWISGSPDNSGSSEHCAWFDRYNGYEDSNCDSATYYICEDDLLITDAPNDLEASVQSTTSAIFTWSAPLQMDAQNADLIGYKLYYWIRDKQSESTQSVTVTSADTFTLVLDALAPGTSYEFYITGYNSYGEGPESDPPGNLTTQSAQQRSDSFALNIYRIEKGVYLQSHVIFSTEAFSLQHCTNICTGVLNCQSVNFHQTTSSKAKTCEINEGTKESYSSDVINDSDYIYAGL